VHIVLTTVGKAREFKVGENVADAALSQYCRDAGSVLDHTECGINHDGTRSLQVHTFTHEGKEYDLDAHGFLASYDEWDEEFAEAMAREAGIEGDLTEEHWRIIRFIRQEVKEVGQCPLVFRICRETGVSPHELKSLFPAGYTKGACKIAGITYRDRFMDYFGENLSRVQREVEAVASPNSINKVYRVDTFGFLIDPSEWDEEYAEHKAREMKIPGGLSERHKELIQYLRRTYDETKTVPSVSECLEVLGMAMEEIEQLFPDGYVRGAVKIAGLSMSPA